MKILVGPAIHRSARCGRARRVLWEVSAVHVFASKSPTLFFSIDIHAWPFDSVETVEFTADIFDAGETVAQAV
jgi:hypothetical protein